MLFSKNGWNETFIGSELDANGEKPKPNVWDECSGMMRSKENICSCQKWNRWAPPICGTSPGSESVFTLKYLLEVQRAALSNLAQRRVLKLIKSWHRQKTRPLGSRPAVPSPLTFCLKLCFMLWCRQTKLRKSACDKNQACWAAKMLKNVKRWTPALLDC